MALFPYPNIATAIRKYTSSASIKNYAKAGGIGLVGGELYLNKSGSVGLLADALTTTLTNVGAKNGSTVSVVETGFNGTYHKTVLTLTATPITVADSGAGGNVKLYDFPEGAITFLGGKFSLTPTTTSVLSSTLHAGVVLDIGIGTVGAAGALTTTEDNIIDSVAGTSSATINVAGATSKGVRTTAPAILDGSATAADMLLNIGVPTGTDIDADATVIVTGTVELIWLFGGDI